MLIAAVLMGLSSLAGALIYYKEKVEGRTPYEPLASKASGITLNSDVEGMA